MVLSKDNVAMGKNSRGTDGPPDRDSMSRRGTSQEERMEGTVHSVAKHHWA